MRLQHSQTVASVGQRDTVIILGGKGGLEARYREITQAYGYELKHYEQRLPAKARPASQRIALVLVMVSMVSHPLMARARGLHDDGASVVYLRSPSLSAVRDAMDRATKS
jgi:hypothetical protein